MKISIINIGDELLIGQIINTNAAWLGQFLNENGYEIGQILVVGDDAQEIQNALKKSFLSSNVVLITGGLGPTKDDITVHTLSTYFCSKLVQNEEIIQHLKAYYEKRNSSVDEAALRMASVPECAEVLLNAKGTAASLMIEADGKLLFSMPGVPYEMQDMMSRIVIHKIKARFPTQWIYHKTFMTCGAPETLLENNIKDIQESLPPNFKIAYLPAIGKVRVRLSATGPKDEHIKANLIAQQIKSRLKPYVYAEGDIELEKHIAELLTTHKLTLSLVESCTGGIIAHKLTTIPGSSNYLIGSFVAYANEFKTNIIGVSSKTIEKFGAVSEETVVELVSNVRNMCKTDYAIATTGIAGPTGATADKPVGLVWVAVANSYTVKTKKLQLTNLREINIPMAATLALNELRLLMSEEGLI